MVIHGADDPLVPVEGGRDTAANIPGAELRIVPGVGHEMPPAVRDEFVAKNSTPTVVAFARAWRIRQTDPEVFDADRDARPPHIAFGFGRHRCIGEHLARLEMRVVAQELLRRVPDYQLALGAEIRMRTALVRGPLSLEVTWQA